MSDEEAENYHHEQIDTLAHTAADMISAMTMNYVAKRSALPSGASGADAGGDLVYRRNRWTTSNRGVTEVRD